MNRALGCLQMTRSSLDAHQWKQVLDFEMALYQNEAEATEAIREARAHCGATIREVETCCTTHIRETEANCTSIITEAEACCTADIRKAESHCAEHACSIQQLHAEGMQCLEMEALQKGGKRLPLLPNLLWNGTAGLPPEACGGTNGPPPFTHGEHVLGHSPEHSPSGVFH